MTDTTETEATPSPRKIVPEDGLALTYWRLANLWISVGGVARDKLSRDGGTGNAGFWEAVAHRAALRAGRYARLAVKAAQEESNG